MADINDQEILGVVRSQINDYAKSKIQWHSGSNRGGTYMNTGPLTSPGSFNFANTAFNGNLNAWNILNKIRDEAQKCTSIRRVQTGRKYTGYGSPTWRSVYNGIAALHSGYRQSMSSVHRGTIDYGVGGLQYADRSRLLQHIQAVKSELYSKMNGGLIDLKVCHSSCHDNCHSSRSRR